MLRRFSDAIIVLRQVAMTEVRGVLESGIIHSVGELPISAIG
jgi:hypothetical protein